jgi:Preprotein translocase SecG subunit
MEVILSVVQVVLAVSLIFLVLMHSGKDSGLSARRRLARRAQPQPLDDRLRDRLRRELHRPAQALEGG